MISFARQLHLLYVSKTRNRLYRKGVGVIFNRKSTAFLAIIYANKTSIERLEHATALEGRYETIDAAMPDDAYVCPSYLLL